MKNCFVLFTLFFFATFNSYGQPSKYWIEDSAIVSRIKYINLDLPEKKQETLLPFNKISFIDMRFDTGSCGIYNQIISFAGLGIINWKFNFNTGLQNYFNNYFNQHNNSYVAGGAAPELVCFVKEFNITSADTLGGNAYVHKNYCNLASTIDCWINKGNSYFAFAKLDTSLNILLDLRKGKIDESINSEMLPLFVNQLCQKINISDTSKAFLKKGYTLDELNKGYFRRFDLPILKSPCRKGVYFSFKEFIDNSPSLIDFDVERSRHNSRFIYDKNGNIINTIHAFGFNDGFNTWIFNGNYFYPLVRKGNSFEFLHKIASVGDLKILKAINMDISK